MDKNEDWIIVKQYAKNSFNPNNLKLKNNTNNKIVYEKFYTETKKSLEEIE
jgi:hypothetical protein